MNLSTGAWLRSEVQHKVSDRKEMHEFQKTQQIRYPRPLSAMEDHAVRGMRVKRKAVEAVPGMAVGSVVHSVEPPPAKCTEQHDCCAQGSHPTASQDHSTRTNAEPVQSMIQRAVKQQKLPCTWKQIRGASGVTSGTQTKKVIEFIIH